MQSPSAPRPAPEPHGAPRGPAPPVCPRPRGACARRPATQFTAAPRTYCTCVASTNAAPKRSNALTYFRTVNERETSQPTAKIASQVEMPTSLFGDLGGGGLVEDQRAFQLALELSMLSFGDLPSSNPLASPLGFAPPPDDRAKKSQNMTECVPVPSSEHVAEIVGRQGCKIKALRAKTNTYIKTPVRGEEPVFVVTGRKEDVARAKREILSAAEHFSQIRASRKCGAAPPPPAGAPGHVTAQVRVPYRVVGLVVGPKGATIKRIQHTTHTYIVTPSREREPVFEVTGLPESVEAARKEIEAHIALRTGATGGAGAGATTAPADGEPLAQLYRAGIASLLRPEQEAAFSSAGSCSSGGSSARLGDLLGIWSSTERDEGLGESPSFESPGAGGVWAWGPPRPSPAASPARACAVCGERGVAAALVPCGHNLFCLECAQRLASSAAPCPACAAPAHQAIRILS